MQNHDLLLSVHSPFENHTGQLWQFAPFLRSCPIHSHRHLLSLSHCPQTTPHPTACTHCQTPLFPLPLNPTNPTPLNPIHINPTQIPMPIPIPPQLHPFHPHLGAPKFQQCRRTKLTTSCPLPRTMASPHATITARLTTRTPPAPAAPDPHTA